MPEGQQVSTQSQEGLMIERVRSHMADKSIEQNLLEMDLTWDDKDIMKCMTQAADRFNELNPCVVTISPTKNKWPAMFLEGVGYYMLRMKLMEWQRNDVEYQAGNMQSSPHKKRIEHLGKVAKEMQDSFLEQAKQIKVACNASLAFQSY